MEKLNYYDIPRNGGAIGQVSAVMKLSMITGARARGVSSNNRLPEWFREAIKGKAVREERATTAEIEGDPW